jgi:AraC family transcriptional regulator
MKEEYIKRVNRVLEYIENNLHTDLSLATISEIAFYSPFHLHRLFKAITQEPLNAYISRKRIEKSARQLIHHTKLSIFEIAIQNGFNSPSSFTRAFTKIYGQSPTYFRKAHANNFSKISKMDSKKGKESFITEAYLCNIINLKNWINMNAKINIQEIPETKVAYITQFGVNHLEEAFARMVKWARLRNLLTGTKAQVVRIFHDSFKLTDADKVRMSIGIMVPSETRPEGEVGITTLEKGKHLVGHFLIEPKKFEQAWDSLFLYMHEQGYKKADSFPFEIYYNNYQEHPEKKCIVDLCIPIS